MAQTEKEVVYGKRAMEIFTQTLADVVYLDGVDGFHALFNDELDTILFSYFTCGEVEKIYHRVQKPASDAESSLYYEELGAIVDSGIPNRRVISFWFK